MLEAAVRAIVAVALAMSIGFVFYNPAINPLAKTWVDIVKPKVHSDMTRPLVGTAIAKMLLALFIYSYVYNRTYSLYGLARMAFDLTFMSMLLQLTHYLWTLQDMRLLGINTIYDFIVILAISIVVGYKRVNRHKAI